jgi:hypothetical protein
VLDFAAAGQARTWISVHHLGIAGFGFISSISFSHRLCPVPFLLALLLYRVSVPMLAKTAAVLLFSPPV